jgi:hypothetical protein
MLLMPEVFGEVPVLFYSPVGESLWLGTKGAKLFSYVGPCVHRLVHDHSHRYGPWVKNQRPGEPQILVYVVLSINIY